MSRMILVLLLVSGVMGCRSTVLAPQLAPQTDAEPVEELLPADDGEELVPGGTPSGTPNDATQGFAVIANNALQVRYTVRLEPEWTYEVFINSDNNSQTGRSGGYDFVARGPGLDPFGLVVRSMTPHHEQPNGWGRVTGDFTSQWVGDRQQLRMQIPLTSMPDCFKSGTLRVQFYRTPTETTPVEAYTMAF